MIPYYVKKDEETAFTPLTWDFVFEIPTLSLAFSCLALSYSAPLLYIIN